ncbi:MAG: hypothetical protein ABS98_01290 [Lysobacteraceae bacterium SCN 69-48]|nr:MAG: hypothetical protein ABS98_01290 [Xanthomonadaceae bacterium SCN 69-48]
MMKFNKSLLTAAVVGALALPGLASAASLSYPAGKQITFAKDLIVNNGTTIYTPSELTLRATTDDAARIATVAGDNVTVKVTLTDGAKFDATADATTLVNGFKIGAELGGTGLTVAASPVGTLVGTPYYSASGQELNFTIKAPGNGADAVDPAYAVQLNSMQITNLVQGLFTGSKVGVEITAQNQSGQQILASKADLAKSVWGLTAAADLTGSDSTGTKKIDVGSTNSDGSPDPRTWFSASGAVGGSGLNGATAGSGYFNLGAVVIDIAEAALIGGGSGYVNNYSAVLPNPEYNVVSTAKFDLSLTAEGFSAYNGAIAFSASPTCSSTVGSTTQSGDTVTLSLLASSPLLANVTAASPSASTLYVCAIANGTRELVKVDSVRASVAVDYQLSTQRVNPTLDPFSFGSIGFNGTDLVFQNVNPAGNATAQSFLRLTNNNAAACLVEIEGKDDAGKYSRNPVKLTIPAHASATVNSDDLENGNAGKGITGGFTDGSGKWYVRVNAQCSNFKASALNRNSQTGTVTDLTPEKTQGLVEWSVNKANKL